MADFSAPSFSLGLDLDLDLDLADLPTEGEEEQEEEEDKVEDKVAYQPHSLGAIDVEDDADFQTLGRNPEASPPALKRLRRGSAPPPPAAPVDGRGGADQAFVNLDDEIEEYSSHEERPNRRDDCLPLQSRRSCSTSKLSLHKHGFLSSRSTSESQVPRISSAPPAPTIPYCEASNDGDLLSKLKTSPPRKFVLLDSDSDDSPPTKGEKFDMSEDAKGLSSAMSTTRKNKKSVSFLSRDLQNESLWKDLTLKHNVNIATPALDEFCEEYFSPQKGPKLGQQKRGDACSRSFRRTDHSIDDCEGHYMENDTRNSEQTRNLPGGPPSHQYYNHPESRIQKGQFGQNDLPSRSCGSRQGICEGSSKVRKRKPNAACAEETSNDPANWVNPRNNATLPKDAGKRRVRADGHQSGHWFTGQDGRKVYVTKTGQELTGQIAYRHYRKESGAGFKKSRKKTSVKNKAGAKRKRTTSKR